MDNLKDKLNAKKAERIEVSPSERPIPNYDSIKKFYIKPDDKTRILNNKYFVEFVAETINKSNEHSLNLIKSGKVSVNRDTVIDENFNLTSGDVVRVGVLGHFLIGPNNIAIVK